MHVEEFKTKQQQTMLNRYGEINASHVEEFKTKRIETNLRRYGVENVRSSSIIKDQIKKTNQQNYDVDYVHQLHIDPICLKLLKSKHWLTEQHHNQERTITYIVYGLVD